MKLKMSFGAASLLVAGVCLLGSPQAKAVTLVDTITGGGLFTGLSGLPISNNPGLTQSLALEFTSSSAVTISSITAYIGVDTGPIALGIMSDASGSPSGTFLFSQNLSSSPNAVVLNPVNWSIAGNTMYWLAAVATTSDAFGAWTPEGPTHLWAFNVGAGWETKTSAAPEALIVADNLSTPLPAALPMFMAGAGLIGLLARRRKQKRAAYQFRLWLEAHG